MSHNLDTAHSELPDDADTTAALVDALDDADPTIRRYAALTLGGRGVNRVVPVLVSLIVEGERDVEAAEVLGMLTRENAAESRILSAVTDALDEPATTREGRMRLTQALLELGGSAADETLHRLANDHDPQVARLAAIFSALPREGSRYVGNSLPNSPERRTTDPRHKPN